MTKRYFMYRGYSIHNIWSEKPLKRPLFVNTPLGQPLSSANGRKLTFTHRSAAEKAIDEAILAQTSTQGIW